VFLSSSAARFLLLKPGGSRPRKGDPTVLPACRFRKPVTGGSSMVIQTIGRFLV
jgi:hypothetical protein